MITNVILLCLTVTCTFAAPSVEHSSLLIKSLGGGSEYYTQIAAAVLRDHNYYRAKHGVPALVLDTQLNDFATNWAMNLVQNSSSLHRPNNVYGENIFWSSNYYRGKTDLEIVGLAVKGWYDEVERYNFDLDRDSVQYGATAFTQMIWRTSQELGVGVGRGTHDRFYLVCNYSPRGNIHGHYKANVPKPVNSNITKTNQLGIY